jgi:hypothetical protein
MPPSKDRIRLSQPDEVFYPMEQRRRRTFLSLHVHAPVAVHRIGDDRRVQAGGVGARKAGVAVNIPLHGCAHAVAIIQVDIVAHANLVAIVDDGRAGQREQQRVE